MAQIDKSFDKAIDEVLEDYKNAISEAAKYASAKALDAIYKYSLTCLEEYYANYDPTTYDRTDTLWHAFVPYFHMETNNGIISSTVGIEYSPSELEKYIGGDIYAGSKKYGYADAEWVIQNYYNGVHPATNGSSIPGEAVYYRNIDWESPGLKMERFLAKKMPKQFYKDILKSLATNAIYRR